ncbi:MAG TPA: HIT domain-containing protein [Acidimicrobiales bacterium]
MSLERLWAGWRSGYVSGLTGGSADAPSGGATGCVFCRILSSGEPDSATYVVWRGGCTAAVLNAFPYTSGHVLVLPLRHVAEPGELAADEAAELWASVTAAVAALRGAYRPQGINLGANLGEAAGAGVPGHFHVHALPRWNGDTSFMTSLAEVRVLPEALPDTWERLRSAWPS